jgi:hypothetical protein
LHSAPLLNAHILFISFFHSLPTTPQTLPLLETGPLVSAAPLSTL